MEMQTKTHFSSLKRLSQSSKALPKLGLTMMVSGVNPASSFPSQTILLQTKEQNKQKSKYPQQKITSSFKRKKITRLYLIIIPSSQNTHQVFTVFLSDKTEINTSKNYTYIFNTLLCEWENLKAPI